MVRNDELYHYGVKGMKWGVRNYQNPDGSYTEAGRSHYGFGERRRGVITYKDERSEVRKSSAFQRALENHKRKKAQKILNKLDNFSNSRKKFMTANQRKSVEEARAYWKAIAKGKKPSKDRNIIKRYLDKERADSLPKRAAEDVAKSFAESAAIEVGKHYIVKKTGAGYYPVNIAKITRSATSGLGRRFITNELLIKILGHY